MFSKKQFKKSNKSDEGGDSKKHNKGDKVVTIITKLSPVLNVIAKITLIIKAIIEFHNNIV